LDIPDALIESFTAAVTTALREMAGVEVVVRDTSRLTAVEALADVSAGLRLDGAAEWWAILSFPAATAAALARRVFAEVGGEPGDMIRDCAAEVLNVTAGQAKTLVFGTPHHFTLSTPTPLGAGPLAGAGGAVVRFDSDAGAFALYLCPSLTRREG
jgi:CheY-specific phosphatase CheX